MVCLKIVDTKTKKAATGTSTNKNHGSTTPMRLMVPTSTNANANTFSRVSGKTAGMHLLRARVCVCVYACMCVWGGHVGVEGRCKPDTLRSPASSALTQQLT